MRSDQGVTVSHGTRNLELLKRMFCAGTPAFVLVDPLIGEPLPGEVEGNSLKELLVTREALWGRPITIIPLKVGNRVLQWQQPYLVSLEGAEDSLLETTLEIAEAERNSSMEGGIEGAGAAVHRIGAWIHSSLFPAEIAAQIGEMMRVRSQSLINERYLRLADRRVFAWLRCTVGDGRVASQFGRIQRWAYLDLLGRVEVMNTNSSTPEFVDFEIQEWMKMQKGQEIHRSLAKWMGTLNDSDGFPETLQFADKFSARNLYEGAFDAIGHAYSAAKILPNLFWTIDDFTSWAALVLLHPNFKNNGFWTEVMNIFLSSAEPVGPISKIGGQLHAQINEMQRKNQNF